VADCLKNLQTRLYPVGRLDYDTTGALIMTNDGDLAYRLAHPKYMIEKVYQAVVRGFFSKEDAELIMKGIKLPDGHIARALIKILGSNPNSSKIGLILTEGRKREVKNILKAVKHPVIYLQRVAFAGLGVDDLKPGRWKYIGRSDVKMLKKLVRLL
jgi:23S rRNA pseudouridine2605 synthase